MIMKRYRSIANPRSFSERYLVILGEIQGASGALLQVSGFAVNVDLLTEHLRVTRTIGLLRKQAKGSKFTR